MTPGRDVPSHALRVFVSIDMEGIAGISDRRQVQRGTDDFAEARALMAGEANAAVAGAFAAGATEVVVNDSHGDLTNLTPSDLDPRALLQTGSGKGRHEMVFDAGSGFDAALFVGYHSEAGRESGVLAHTHSSTCIYDLRVNGECWGELELNAALIASWGIPLVFVSGDDTVCATAAKRFPGINVAPVKVGLGNRAARSLSPARARELIQTEVEAALCVPASPPVPVDGPFELSVRFVNAAMADNASILPGCRRTDGRTVAIEAQTVDEVGRYQSVLTALASSYS